ncbi:MAG: sigma-70 family RNA polymerase sigma factor [Planctomycetia bacterium]|nr:sigma-70 family RNA polymerase sigma factor [Planctomycetia bacterium]
MTPDPLDRFTLLITEAQFPLFSFILTLVPDATDAKDVLQETNLALLAKRDQYDPARPFWPWACTFARFQALAHVKTARRDHHQFDTELVGILADESIEETSESERELAALSACLKKLERRSAELLKMRYSESLSCDTIAQRLGRTPAAIWTALHRARNVLAECVQTTLAAKEGH